MAAFPTPKGLLLALGLLFSLSQLHSTLAALYKVGDFNGKWGADNYFQAGDLLSFVNHTQDAAVHEVSRKDYKACETVKPIRTYRDGDNVAHLKEQSTYYFISGAKSQCKRGRKLVVVVLASAPGSSSPAKAPSVPNTTPPPTVVVVTPPPSVPPVAPPTATPAATPPSTVAPSSPPTTSAPTPTTAAAPPGSAPSPLSSISPGPGATTASPPSPPTPPGPASQPAAPSAASLTDVRKWVLATAGLCSGLVLLL